MSIPYPIEQFVTGNSGVYEVYLIQRESRSLSKYKKMVESFDHLTFGKRPVDIEKLVHNHIINKLVLEKFKIVSAIVWSRLTRVNFRFGSVMEFVRIENNS
jgi:hypothetical protein